MIENSNLGVDNKQDNIRFINSLDDYKNIIKGKI